MLNKMYFAQLWDDIKRSPWYIIVAGIAFLLVSLASFFIIQNPFGGLYALNEAYTETYINNGFTLFNFEWFVLPEWLWWIFKSIGLFGSLFGFTSIMLFMQAKKSGMPVAVVSNICLCFSMIAAELNLNALLFIFWITPLSIYSIMKWKKDDGNEEGQFKYSNWSWITLICVFAVAFIIMLFLQYIFVGDALFTGAFYPQKLRVMNWLDLTNNATYVVAWFGLMKRNIRYLIWFFFTDFMNLLMFTPVSPIEWTNLPMTLFYLVLVLHKPLHFWYWKTKVPVIKDEKIRIW